MESPFRFKEWHVRSWNTGFYRLIKELWWHDLGHSWPVELWPLVITMLLIGPSALQSGTQHQVLVLKCVSCLCLEIKYWPCNTFPHSILYLFYLFKKQPPPWNASLSCGMQVGSYSKKLIARILYLHITHIQVQVYVLLHKRGENQTTNSTISSTCHSIYFVHVNLK